MTVAREDPLRQMHAREQHQPLQERARSGVSQLIELEWEQWDWDHRERELHRLTGGLFHPRKTVGEHRPAQPKDVPDGPGGPEGCEGKEGRVTVITPTTESRRKFHPLLWACFEAQSWPDKELVVIETCVSGHASSSSSRGREVTRAAPRVTPRYCIVGSWSDWKIEEMKWDGASQCYRFPAELNKKGWASFQILLNGDWATCLHPDRADANPYSDYVLCGPDSKGHGKNWTIRKHPHERGREGATCTIMLYLKADGSAESVDWTVQSAGGFLAQKAKEDSRLTYVSFPLAPGRDWSIGLKRNLGVHLATGSHVAHFDDDDLYAPEYLSEMVRAMDERNALGITLSSWYIFDTKAGIFGFCDPLGMGEEDNDDFSIMDWVYGYGFSYVYRRGVAFKCPYPNQNMGEDLAFCNKVRSHGGKDSFALFRDEAGFCLHLQHGGNTSHAFALWELPRKEAIDLEVADLGNVFSQYMAFCPERTGGKDRSEHFVRGAAEAAKLPKRPRIKIEVVAHTQVGDFEVACPAGALGGEFMALLAKQVGAGLAAAFQVLRESPGSGGGEEVAPDARIGTRTRELWLQLPEGRVARRGCRRLPGGSHTPVHVTCEGTPVGKSVSNVFHVELPPDATVADLRSALGGALPASARVTAFLHGLGEVAEVDDCEPVPDMVTLSAFDGEVNIGMVMTLEQVVEVAALMKAAVERPGVQRQLEEIHEQAEGRADEYRIRLGALLINEVYPDILRRFSLPAGQKGYNLIRHVLAHYRSCSVPLLEMQLETELLLRDHAGARRTYEMLGEMRSRQQAGSPEHAEASGGPQQG